MALEEEVGRSFFSYCTDHRGSHEHTEAGGDEVLHRPGTLNAASCEV